MRTFGVEEELLLVDARSHAPVAAASQLLRQETEDAADAGPQLEAELQQEMIEVITSPSDSAAGLRAQIEAGRARADAAAQRQGARVAALATSPLALDPHVMPKSRYLRMLDRYGITARRTLVCGCHVHVSVESDEEGVAVLDRIRVWLPVLLALSANSPYAGGEDTGYASYRSVVWNQWPSAGPLPVLGSLERYREHERRLLETGVLMDEGMLYFDARLSRAHPTVEVRIFDVMPEAETAAAMAALVRGLVDAAAREWREGRAAPAISVAELKLDVWQAGLAGVASQLVHPIERRRMPAAEVVAALFERARPALEESGDADVVEALLWRLLDGGSGAARQREILREEGSLEAVVSRAVAWTVR